MQRFLGPRGSVTQGTMTPQPLEAVMDLLRSGLLMRKTRNQQGTELTE